MSGAAGQPQLPFELEALRRYVCGDAAATRAVAAAVAAVPPGAPRVLDLSGGVGWAAHEVARAAPRARVVAVLGGARASDAATRLFAAPNLTVTRAERGRLPAGPFDVVTFVGAPGGPHPCTAAGLEAALELLAPGGRLVIEAGALGASVGALLVRAGPAVHRIGGEAPDPAAPLEPLASRAARTERQLGMRWTPAGFLATRAGPTVCVVMTRTDAYSETFIQAHLRGLEARVHLLCGAPHPWRDEAGRSLLAAGLRGAGSAIARALDRPAARVEERLFGLHPTGLRARTYAAHLRRLGADAVLAEYGTNAVELLDGCRRAGIPLITHFHGFDAFHRPTLEERGARYRELFGLGDPVVAVSASMARQLVRLGATPAQVTVIPYGVDAERFRPGSKDAGLVAAVGRFVDKKAPEASLLAFARAAAEVPSARLVMVGDGPLRAAVERLARALGVADRVAFLGPLAHHETAALLARAAVFVQHSIVGPDGDREGLPNAVLEACASGAAVVATRHEGIADVLTHGETGLLVAEGDVEAMGAAVRELLAHPARAAELGAAARAHVGARHDAIAALRRLDQVVAAAIADRGRLQPGSLAGTRTSEPPRTS